MQRYFILSYFKIISFKAYGSQCKVNINVPKLIEYTSQTEHTPPFILTEWRPFTESQHNI